MKIGSEGITYLVEFSNQLSLRVQDMRNSICLPPLVGMHMKKLHTIANTV